MRAAILSEYQTSPAPGERPAPLPADGQAVIELLAAPLNPADVAIASGSFPAGSPPLPYVPGIEGVGSVVSVRSLLARHASLGFRARAGRGLRRHVRGAVRGV